MELEDLKQHWDCFGKTDPLWAILTDPERKSNRWNVEEFVGTGEVWVADLNAGNRGVGRETQPIRTLPRFRLQGWSYDASQMQAF